MIPFAIENALSLAWRNWKLIAGGLVVATLGVLLLLAKGDARSWEKQALQNKARFDTEVLAHAVTRTSLNMLQTALEDQSRTVRNLAAESDARTLAAGDAKKAAQAAVQAAERTAKALDTSAATPRAGAAGCPPSETFWASRKEL